MTSFVRRLALVSCLCVLSGAAYAQCISLASPGTPVAENFDTLSATAASTTNVLSLPGWAMVETGGGTRDNAQYAVDTGASNSGDTYSYGSAGSSDRALGSVRSSSLVATFGACYVNDTGAQMSALGIAYTAEQWRVGTLGRLDQMTFEYSTDATSLTSGTWAQVAALGFATPDLAARNGTGSAGARNGNAVEMRMAISADISGLSVPAGGTVWIRWNDIDASSADDGMAIDELSVTAGGNTGTPSVSISDTGAAEGAAGTTQLLFTISLDHNAGPGGVTVDYATSDVAAAAGSDYVAASGTVTIPEGSSSITIGVDILGDTVDEANETFAVDLANANGAAIADARAVGTIYNDDMALTPIHDVQGNGAMSPLVGSSVTVRGIVTGRKATGFFVQAPDAEADTDPATSEGVFVYTSIAPPAAAAVGNLVLVTAAVAEYVPSADPYQLPLTELTAPSVLQLSTGNPLPTPVGLTTSLPAPSGALDQLERYEGMRVTAASFTVVAPTGGSTTESSATGSTNGLFNVVVTGTPRPFREPGIQAPDAPPSGSVPPIPRWDYNPELLVVDSDALDGTTPLDVSAGTTIEGLAGPLDYSFRRYTLLRNAGTGTLVGPVAPTEARAPSADEFTVAGYNMERFFDTSNDPAISEPVLTTTAFANRLRKASIAILDYLHSPDIVATVEIENLTTLQALASKVNSDAAMVGQSPGYVAYLQEGNDVGGIDVGFLVKTSDIGGGVARVEVVDVTQFGKAATWLDPSDNTQHLLNDRPPLLLRAIVHYTDGRAFPISVLAVHQRSLNGADSTATDGFTSEGDRVRRKRQAQAEYLANLVQQRQVADPQEHLVVLGDFNAFEFNDGYVDAMGVATGKPAPDDQTVVAGDGVDLVEPDLINLLALEQPAQRYSFVFGGNAQSLDHLLVNEALVADTGNIDLDHARINADFPETNRNDAGSPSRLSDHDPLLAYFSVDSADLAITGITATPGPYHAGVQVGYDVTLANNGASAAGYPGAGFVFSTELPLSIQPPAGWTCTAPVAVNGTTQATCNSTSPFANGAIGVFHLDATLPAGLGSGYLTLDAAVSAQTYDPVPENNSASITSLVASSADLSVALAAPSHVQIGREASIVARVSNIGPDATELEDLRFHVNVPGAYVRVANAACAQYGDGTGGIYPANNGGTYVLCGPATLQPGGYVEYDLRVRPPVGAQFRQVIDIKADALGTDPDPQTANDSATAQVKVIWRALE